MSTSNNEATIQDSKSNNTTEETINEKSEEEKMKLEYELKIKKIKEQLKSLLKTSLGKNIYNLESKTKEQLKILKTTTDAFNDFDKKIKLLIKQVEENSHMKKIKATSSKKRSKTVPRGNRTNLNINNESKNSNNTINLKIKRNSNYKIIKPESTIRSKSTDPRQRKSKNIDKKSLNNLHTTSIYTENDNLNNTTKLKKVNSNKFNLTESNFNHKKKVVNEYTNNTDKKRNLNNSRTKSNVSKSKKNLNSSSNISASSKDKNKKYEMTKVLSRKAINRKDITSDGKKANEFSSKNIPKPKINNSDKKNILTLSEKKFNSHKKLIKDIKNTNINANTNANANTNTNTNENINDNINVNANDDVSDSDDILKRFQEQKERLQNLRKQREMNILKEEEKKKEEEKEKEEERIREERRKKREMEERKKEEERLKEEERIRDEERRKKQMEIEAEIEREKMEKEKIRKEIEKEKEEEKKRKEREKQKEIEKEKEIERQIKYEKQKKLMEEKKKEEEKKREERRKKEEEERKIEEERKLKEMEKLKEEEKLNEKDLSKDLNYEENDINDKNEKLDLQELLELHEKIDNSDNDNINEDISKEIGHTKEILDTSPTPIPTPVAQIYRNISLFELIHEVKNFGPCLFQFLDLKDLVEFTSTSKKIKRHRIYFFNMQKKSILNLIDIEKEEILEKKILEYEENYSEEVLSESYSKFHLSRGASKAVELLNRDLYSKIFRRPVLDNNLSKIIVIYRILIIFMGQYEISNISEDMLFWVKFTEYLNSNSEGKIGDFIIKQIEKCDYSHKAIFFIEKMIKGKKEDITPSNFTKICSSTGLLIFLIRELMEYCGIIIDPKKTQISRIYNNLKFYKNLEDTLSGFIQSIENFN